MKKTTSHIAAIFLSFFLIESAKADTWIPDGDASLSTTYSGDIILGYAGRGTFTLRPGGSADSFEGINAGGGSLFMAGGTITNTTPAGVNTILSHISIGSDTTVTTTASLNARTIDIGYDNSVLNMNGGTLGSSSAVIQINHNGILNYNGGSIAGYIRSEAAGQGNLNINTNFSSSLPIGTSRVPIGTIAVASGVTFSTGSDVFANNINLTGTATVTGGTFGYSGGTITLNSGGILNFSGSSIAGKISAGSSGSGTFNINGDYSSSATIGLSSAPIGTLNVASGKTFTSNYDVSADNIVITGTTNVTAGNFGYSGTTTNIASGGKLSLSGGAILGTVNGSSSGVGTIEISGNVTNSTEIGSVNSIGTLNILTGKTFVNSADITANQVNINGTMLLSAPTTITGNVTIENGTLSLTRGSEVNGDIAIDGSSRLDVTITDSATAGSLIADNITLSPNADLTINIDPNSDYIANGTSFTVLNDGGSGAAVNDIKDIRNGSMIFSTSKDSNGDLIVAISRISPSSITNAEHARAVYTNIEEGVSTSVTGTLRSFRNYLNSSSVSDLQRDVALKSAAPQVDNSVNRNLINIANLSMKNIENRLDDPKNYGVASGDEAQKHRLWVKPFGSKIKQGVRGNDDGYNANSKGISIGTDKEISEDLTAGFSITYSDSEIKTFAKDKNVSVKTYQLDFYGRHNFEKFFLDGILGFAQNEYRSIRAIDIVNVSARAKYDGNAIVGKLRGGVVNKFGNLSVTPALAFTSVRSKTHSYSEYDAGTIGLNVARSNFDFFEGRFGVNFDYEKTLKNGAILSPNLYISYGHDFIGDRQFTTANFVGQSAAFTVQGNKVDQNSWIIGGGFDLASLNSIDFAFDYNLEHKAKYDAHTTSLKMKYGF